MNKICYRCSKPLLAPTIYGLHNVCFKKSFDLAKIVEFSDVVRHAASSSSSDFTNEQNAWNSSFFQGKFKKYSARLAGTEYILKIQEDFAPELPFVEFLCNQIAELIGLKIPSYYLIDFLDIPCFVSKNFVTNLVQANTLDHIYHFISKEDDYSCKSLLKIIEKETSNVQSVEQFIEICLYDALVGNHDRHGRNLGFLRTRQTIKLAPCYDNTSALGLESGNMLRAQFSPRGKIATTNTIEPTMKDYVKDFSDMGFNSNIHKFYQKLNLQTIDKLIQSSFCSNLMKTAMSALISNRYQELSDAL